MHDLTIGVDFGAKVVELMGTCFGVHSCLIPALCTSHFFILGI